MAMRHGDFTVRLPMDRTGVAGKIYDTLNEIAGMIAARWGTQDKVPLKPEAPKPAEPGPGGST